MQSMNRAKDHARQIWLNSTAALQLLNELTGTALSGPELMFLCVSEQCRAYIDCSFAAGPAPADQLFVRKVKGAGHCELLEADNLTLSAPTGDGEAVLYAEGMAIVHGSAWVYSAEGGEPVREDGIWRINLARVSRPLCFRPVDLQSLAAAINAGELRRQAPSKPSGRKSAT